MADSDEESPSFVKGLGNIATGIFTCGGTLDAPASVDLAYSDKTGQWCKVTFPGLEAAHLQHVVESSQVASFGRGKEELTDKNVRDAYVLEKDQFICSLQVSDTVILQEIKAMLVPDIDIRTELYKINVYTSPTGHFKSHVDTPRGGNMFGSLVVCLPSQFSGGTLVTRHNGQEFSYNWSSPVGSPAQKIQWAAFFSDVQHEILPVTEGYRVTLTFNLYHSDQINLGLDTTSPFYSYLKAAVANPHFLRGGGILGFGCQHVYVFEQFNNENGKHMLLLKGSDRTVFSAAKSLNLKVQVKPILEITDAIVDYEDEDDPREDLVCIGNGFELKSASLYNKEWMHLDWKTYFQKDYADCYKDGRDIIWCRPLEKHYPSLFAADYGNQPECSVCYQAAAILVTIPRWGERHHS